MEVINGSYISTGTFQTDPVNGKGKGGNIEIATTGDINLSGVITSSSAGKGDTGKITIDTKGSKLLLVNGGLIVSSIASPNALVNSKGIQIDAGELELTNGSSIQTGATDNSRGNAGNIKISTTGDIKIFGSNPQFINSALGDVSGINASSFGRGEVGDISIDTKGSLFLVNQGIITSIGDSINGGNIKLTIGDKLLLRNFSSISTDSGGKSQQSNGGNITITSPLIIALQDRRSDNNITANAYQGKGGRVNITSEGLFGIQKRDRESPFTNDITASSQFNQQGTVDIDTPGADPGRDSTELPNTTTINKGGVRGKEGQRGRGRKSNLEIRSTKTENIDRA